MNPNATAEYGPDNPRDWNPNHPSLRSPLAPHESAGILRMHRAGHGGAAIMKMFKLKGTTLMRAMQRALDAEGIAASRGVKIHDAVFKQ